MKLIKRTDPGALDPNNCCFLFYLNRSPVFRIYSRENNTFVDYEITDGITPFVKIVDGSIELKEYLDKNGKLYRTMDFTEFALSCGKVALLEPGQVWKLSEADTKSNS